jgi:serine protease Do
MNRYHARLCGLSLALAVAALAWTGGVPAQAEDVGTNRVELIQSVLPAVVNVTVKKNEVTPPVTSEANASAPQAGGVASVKGYVGSGFVVDPSGVIVTNYHVVENAFEIIITFTDGRRLPGKVTAASRLADLALLKVEAGHPLLSTHWGDSDKVQVGDQVFAAGNPFGLGLSLSTGIVSALNRDIQNSPYDDLIQTDAPINHGNSGGPLFDMQGNVIGVNSAIISPTTGSVGLGFAEPSASARFVIDRLQQYGWVRPAWIGVKVQQVTPDIAQALGMAQPEGSIIAWVLPGGPAQKAGLAIGDVVLRLNGHAQTDERALLRYIARSQVGATITMQVRHEGTEHEISLATMEWPRNQWDVLDAPVAAQRPKIVIPPDLGLTLSPLADDQKTALKLPDDQGAVLVTNVAAGSDPATRGMVNGDVILRVQGKPVSKPEDVQAEIDAVRADKHDFVLMLVLPKTQTVPGPKWMPLLVRDANG